MTNSIDLIFISVNMLAIHIPKNFVHSLLLEAIYGAQMHFLKPILQVYDN